MFIFIDTMMKYTPTVIKMILEIPCIFKPRHKIGCQDQKFNLFENAIFTFYFKD